MAFNFNAVQSEIQDKANIFAPTQGQVPTKSTTTKSNSPFSSPAPSSGSVSKAAVPVQAGVRGSGSGGAYNPAAVQKSYDGLSAGGFQGATDKIQGSITAASDSLQSKANEYGAKAATTADGYKLNDADLDKAASGDASAFSTVGSRLSKTAADPFEAFGGLSNDEIPTAASAVSKPSTFGDIYRPTAGSNYSGSENSLDSLLLRRNNQFRDVALQLGQSQEDLIGQNAKQQDELTASTREMLGQKYLAETTSAKDRLGVMSKGVIDAAKQKEIEEETRRKGLDSKALALEELAKLKPGQLEALKASGLERAGGLLDGVDLSDYLKLNTDVDYTDFLDEAGAGKFNRINSLLGTNSSILAPTKARADYDFDVNGANSFLASTVMGKQQAIDRENEMAAAAAAQAEAQRAQVAQAAEADRQRILKNQAEQAAKRKAIEDQERAYQEKLAMQRGAARQNPTNSELRRGI